MYFNSVSQTWIRPRLHTPLCFHPDRVCRSSRWLQDSSAGRPRGQTSLDLSTSSDTSSNTWVNYWTCRRLTPTTDQWRTEFHFKRLTRRCCRHFESHLILRSGILLDLRSHESLYNHTYTSHSVHLPASCQRGGAAGICVSQSGHFEGRGAPRTMRGKLSVKWTECGSDGWICGTKGWWIWSERQNREEVKEEVQEMSGGEDILLLVWEGGGSEEFTAVRGQITNLQLTPAFHPRLSTWLFGARGEGLADGGWW